MEFESSRVGLVLSRVGLVLSRAGVESGWY